jgi:hypothetical protein
MGSGFNEELYTRSREISRIFSAVHENQSGKCNSCNDLWAV